MSTIEVLAPLLLEEIAARFQLVTDEAGNVFPSWPSPAEVVAAVAARINPAAPAFAVFTPTGGQADGTLLVTRGDAQ